MWRALAFLALAVLLAVASLFGAAERDAIPTHPAPPPDACIVPMPDGGSVPCPQRDGETDG